MFASNSFFLLHVSHVSAFTHCLFSLLSSTKPLCCVFRDKMVWDRMIEIWVMFGAIFRTDSELSLHLCSMVFIYSNITANIAAIIFCLLI